MSPGLACALMAAATALACVRCVVTFWADDIRPGHHRQPDDDDADPRVEQRRRPQRDEEEEGQEHDGGVAGGERAGREDAAGDGGEQRARARRSRGCARAGGCAGRAR